MIEVDLPKISTDNLHYEPFFHIEVKNCVSREINDKLHRYYVENATWEEEEKSDKVKGVCLDNVQHGIDLEFSEWNKYVQKPWLEQLFDVYKLDFPNEYRCQISCTMHGIGTALTPHTDGPNSSAWRYAGEKYDMEITGCITQHVYILDTDQYPESGMEFHYSDFDTADLKPVKQVKSLPGAYVSYRNTPNSLHGVPEQKINFKRILINIRTFW